MHIMKKVQNNIFTILVVYTFALQPIIGAKDVRDGFGRDNSRLGR